MDGRRYVQASFGEVDWVRNLRASGEAMLTTDGRVEPVKAVVLPPDCVVPFSISIAQAPQNCLKPSSEERFQPKESANVSDHSSLNL